LDIPVGSLVLAPPARWVREAVERGAATQPLVFYAAVLRAVGPKSSWLETPLGVEEELPNALIVPLLRGERAAPGDTVLTAWASGRGLTRARVLEGGTAEAPRVRYLDTPADTPPETLPPHSFRRVPAPGDVGSIAACRQGTQHVELLILARASERLMGLGFAGKLLVHPSADCTVLPLVLELKEKDNVYVPVLGAFVRGEVKGVDLEQARVRVEIPRGHDVREVSIAFGRLATVLP
jgi:hypothetical protein